MMTFDGPSSPRLDGLRLVAPLTAEGTALALRPGDGLVALNGLCFVGDREFLAAKLATAAGQCLAMTFKRGEAEWTVLAETWHLGVWDAVLSGATAERQPVFAHLLRNWEIVSATDGRYDLFAQRSSFFTLFMAPLWLMQMRLWGIFAALGATVVLGAVVMPLFGAILYMAASLHVWRIGPSYLRKDRTALGLTLHVVLAAGSETEAHAAYKSLFPNGQFIFGTASAATELASNAL